MGRLAHALPRVQATQRRGRCASLSGAAVAAKTTAPASEVRRLCGRRDTKRSDWRGGRAGPITSRHSAARHRAWRVTGVTIWPACSERSAAQRTERRPVRQAGLVHVPVKEPRPAIPGHGNGPLLASPPAQPAWPCCVRDGSPSGARRWAFDSGSTRSATARPRAAGTRPKKSAKHNQLPTPCQLAAQRHHLRATLAPSVSVTLSVRDRCHAFPNCG